jgi:hypothetical protein
MAAGISRAKNAAAARVMNGQTYALNHVFKVFQTRALVCISLTWRSDYRPSWLFEK